MGHSREKGCKVCILILQITNIILPIKYCTCINMVLLTFTHFRCAVFIRPSRDGPYYVIGYGGRASTQVSAQ